MGILALEGPRRVRYYPFAALLAAASIACFAVVVMKRRRKEGTPTPTEGSD